MSGLTKSTDWADVEAPDWERDPIGDLLFLATGLAGAVLWGASWLLPLVLVRRASDLDSDL